MRKVSMNDDTLDMEVFINGKVELDKFPDGTIQKLAIILEKILFKEQE